MLAEHSIHDQTWGKKGYMGLLEIKENYDVDVFFKEDIQTRQEINRSVEEFVNKGVNLIFGHSNIYGEYFTEISQAYPEVQFVYFNGGYKAENVTSLNFNSRAMGFFSGMVAAKMTETSHVGIISAFEWQPEIEGFYEGATYQDPSVNVHMEYVNSWNDKENALEIFDNMLTEDVDVFYPAGNAFSVPLINKAKEEGLYAIGYISDQSNLGEKTVLTSTVQHVDKLYEVAAEKFDNGKLNENILVFDFQDDVITLGEFSPQVPESFQDHLKEVVKEYKETGTLPFD